MTKVQNKFASLNRIEREFTNINKWSPADIYMATQTGKNVKLDSAKSILELNTILLNNLKSKDTEVDFHQNKITVKIPKAEYEKYQMFDKSYDKIFHSSIVLGVLTQAISYICDDDLREEYEEYNWFNLINLTIEANNIEKTNDNFSIANKILDNPIHRGFDILRKSVEEE